MKVILVTGSNRGIGKETIRQLARVGHKTILTGRNADHVRDAQDDLAAEGVITDAFACDVRDEAQVRKLVQYVDERYGKLDVLVNNAGIFLVSSDSTKADIDIIRQTFDTNVLGPYRMIEVLLPLLRKSGDARIINLSSGMGGLTEMDGGYPGYRISKTALNAVTRIFANDLAKDKISVNSVCPGWVKTDMGGERATREVEQGAETIVWLATTEKPPTGKFLRDKKEIPW
ncbi:MAG TPA: SDR family oxidoreductase [Turneriella sp.]|nr:SDR family oxidoreductase [Turneriella sp.]